MPQTHTNVAAPKHLSESAFTVTPAKPSSASASERAAGMRLAWPADAAGSERTSHALDLVRAFDSAVDVRRAAVDIRAAPEKAGQAHGEVMVQGVNFGATGDPAHGSVGCAEWVETDDSDDTSSSSSEDEADKLPPSSLPAWPRAVGAIGELAAARLRCAVLEQQAAMCWGGPPPRRSLQKRQVRAAQDEVADLRRTLAELDEAEKRGAETLDAGRGAAGRCVSPEVLPCKAPGVTGRSESADKRPAVPGVLSFE